MVMVLSLMGKGVTPRMIDNHYSSRTSPFHSSMACGWLTPPVLPALWVDSRLLEELPTQLGAVVLTYVSLSEAFFPVSCF